MPGIALACIVKYAIGVAGAHLGHVEVPMPVLEGCQADNAAVEAIMMCWFAKHDLWPLLQHGGNLPCMASAQRETEIQDRSVVCDAFSSAKCHCTRAQSFGSC